MDAKHRFPYLYLSVRQAELHQRAIRLPKILEWKGLRKIAINYNGIETFGLCSATSASN